MRHRILQMIGLMKQLVVLDMLNARQLVLIGDPIIWLCRS